jgi:hypothetical protein
LFKKCKVFYPLSSYLTQILLGHYNAKRAKLCNEKLITGLQVVIDKVARATANLYPNIFSHH